MSSIINNNFVDFIVKNSLGYLSHKELDELFNLLESETSALNYDETATANFYRILEAQFDKGNFIKELLIYPHHTEIISSIAYYSNYLTDILVVHPEYTSLIFNPTWLGKDISENSLSNEFAGALGKLKTLKAKVNLLKTMKMRYMLKIGLNDLLGNYDLDKITNSLSVLAKVILGNLFSMCFDETLKKYEVQSEHEYSLISLGKLGGNELNYSSDVDLMVIYKENYKLNDNLEYHQIITDAIKLFIELGSTPDEKGYLYRIDFRLRPDGKSSPLARTFHDTINYYEVRGEAWEKQMLLKMNFISGDISLYNKFYSFVDKFIYSNLSETSVLEQVKKMKRNIEQQSGDNSDVKLFPGGIRDIEFSVQALQLINGKRKPELKSGHTLAGIDKLNSAKLLNKTESTLLKKAYIFYRKIEHILQLMNDRQTHTIPEDAAILNRICQYTGYKNLKAFDRELQKYRKQIKTFFDNLTEEDSGGDSFNKIEFNDKKRARSNLQFLRSGRGIVGSKEFDARTIDLFTAIEPLLFTELDNVPNKDATLDNFVSLVKASGFPSIFYSQCNSKTFMRSVIKICSLNSMVIEKIKHKPELSELIISSGFTSQPDIDENIPTESFFTNLIIHAGLTNIESSSVGSYLSEFIKKKIASLSSSTPIKIIGLGSFATSEMLPTSDVDIIFLTDKIEKRKGIQDKGKTLLQNLKDELTPFEIDCRLRPEGKSAPLVWDKEEYLTYLNTRARIWELQTLLKIKPVNIEDDYIDEIKNVL
ncbi:MAG: hypothetical protein D6830_03810, partial [Ignavibacteria bacterium]